MRISRRKPQVLSAARRYRINQYIRVPQVRLIDENGQNYGVVDTYKALSMAQERDLDLVEVSPLAQPPVAKIVSFSKMRYQEEKERRKATAKQKKIEIKGIRLSLSISDHDKETKVRQAEKFLSQDDKVKIELILRGREMQHAGLAREIANQFIAAVNQLIPTIVEQPLTIQSGRLSVVIAKQPQ